MKRGQVWLLVACIGIGAVFGLAQGQVEKEAFLNQPLRESCKLEDCIEDTKAVPSQQETKLKK